MVLAQSLSIRFPKSLRAGKKKWNEHGNGECMARMIAHRNYYLTWSVVQFCVLLLTFFPLPILEDNMKTTVS